MKSCIFSYLTDIYNNFVFDFRSNMTYKFYKYQGTGNDFIIFDGINHAFPNLGSEEIAQLCDRRFGIGADGLMIIMPSDDYDFYMLYYNSDGNESTMCGNGGRCIAHLALMNDICEENTTFEAVDGLHTAEINDDIVKLQMRSGIKYTINADKDYIIDTGSPHYIHFDNLEKLQNIVEYGESIRYSDLYKKEGINVNVANVDNDIIHVATYERGVEDETLSCGTGVTAAAIAANEKYNLPSPISIKTKGGNLKVYFKRNGNTYEDVYLEGPAKMVFEGEIELNN